MKVADWAAVCYVILFGAAFVYFQYRDPVRVGKKLVDSLIFANGLTASLIAIFFGMVLPQWFHTTAVYPGPATYISILITLISGGVLGKQMRPHKPRPSGQQPHQGRPMAPP